MATTLSARNHIPGKIIELEVDGVMAHVTIRAGKNLIESVITKRSAEEMKLKVGDNVSAVIKSTEVMLEKSRSDSANYVSIVKSRKARRMKQILLLAAFLAVLTPVSMAQQPASPKVATGPSVVTIGGITTPLTITADDLKKMPRKTLRIENDRDKKTDVYEGVPLEALLQKAGAPLGNQLRGAAMATHVLVNAADDYRVVFSLAELDSGFQDSEVLPADTLDGAPLAPDQGPLKLIVPHDKRPARWVKMVKSITLARAPN